MPRHGRAKIALVRLQALLPAFDLIVDLLLRLPPGLALLRELVPPLRLFRDLLADLRHGRLALLRFALLRRDGLLLRREVALRL